MTKARRFYVSVEVDYFDHRKTLEVGERLAYRNLKAMAWSHKNRTDGFLPTSAALSIVTEAGARDLEAAGFWEHCENGWRIHDYLEHQESKVELERAAKAGRDAAVKRWEEERKRHGKRSGNRCG